MSTDKKNQRCFEKTQNLSENPENLAEGGWGGCPQTKKTILRISALKKPRYPMTGASAVGRAAGPHKDDAGLPVHPGLRGSQDLRFAAGRMPDLGKKSYSLLLEVIGRSRRLVNRFGCPAAFLMRTRRERSI